MRLIEKVAGGITSALTHSVMSSKKLTELTGKRSSSSTAVKKIKPQIGATTPSKMGIG